MKRIFGIFAVLVFTVTASQAQKVKLFKVPVAVKAAFAKLHPTVTANWEMEKQNYEAGFKLNGAETSEIYTANGTLLETEVSIKPNALPIAILTKLKGMKIAEAAKITKADGTLNYEAEVKGKDLLFDTNGNPVKN